jgi:hypothetical protein
MADIRLGLILACTGAEAKRPVVNGAFFAAFVLGVEVIELVPVLLAPGHCSATGFFVAVCVNRLALSTGRHRGVALARFVPFFFFVIFHFCCSVPCFRITLYLSINHNARGFIKNF